MNKGKLCVSVVATTLACALVFSFSSLEISLMKDLLGSATNNNEVTASDTINSASTLELTSASNSNIEEESRDEHNYIGSCRINTNSEIKNDFVNGNLLSNFYIDCISNHADYSSITFLSYKGNPCVLSVSGSCLNLESSVAHSITIQITDSDGNQITGQSFSDSFSYDIGGKLEVGVAYIVAFKANLDGKEFKNSGIVISKADDGSIYFVKSPCYDFNVERCSELLTDEQSLQECLAPQNDINCDDPEVIRIANEITEGCQNDYDKAYAIYSYIVDEFSYDTDQTEDMVTVYQDDALTLLNRKVAICEGLANTFVALSRAVGVPAAVSFGIGSTIDETCSSSMQTDESPNHAWAVVCIEGVWYHLDPTWDLSSEFVDGSVQSTGSSSCNWFLQPLETFSYFHKICDADTIHGIESQGSCGDNATYSIDRQGVITIDGSGTINLPYGVNGFSKIVFAEGSNITEIGEDCFVDCDIITNVILPESLEVIGDTAFNTCEDLQYVYIPESVTSIGDNAFDYCDELAYVYIPDGVSTIGQYAFDDCSRLVISVSSENRSFSSGYTVEPANIIVR